ncbi:unnamed protein product [Malus baccata var. baccata]
MATAVSTIGTVNRAPLSLNGSRSSSVPSSTFLGSNLKKVNSRFTSSKVSSGSLRIVAEVEEERQTNKDKWRGLAFDTSNDQQDITRGKGMVDSLFQAPQGAGTHFAIMSSYEYISMGLRQYNFDNNMDGFYIAPVPLILGIWGGKGQGKSFYPIMMSAEELESGNAGEPAKVIRQRYRETADIIKKGKMCALFINDLDAGAGRLGGTTQYTCSWQEFSSGKTSWPTSTQLPWKVGAGMYNKEENPRVPIIVTGNDFSTLYAPLIREGRMEKFYWAPTREDCIGVCIGIFRSDNVAKEDIVKLVDTFPGQSIDFFGALRARVYDDEVRKWISGGWREGPPTFEQPNMTIEKLLEYGNMLVQEQENVKRVQLADKYLSEAALGKAAQQVNVPVPEGCTDPTARSDDGSCLYTC